MQALMQSEMQISAQNIVVFPTTIEKVLVH